MNDRYDLHAELKSIISKMHAIKNCGQIYLAYGFSQFPWIEIRCDALSVPIDPPKSFYPYKSWFDFFGGYMENQVSSVSRELGIEVFVLTNRETLAPLKKAEMIKEK